MQNELHEDVKPHRQSDHDIDPIFLNRWSPRAFSPEPIDEATLGRVFEAARWAPSCFNEQPWRFIVAKTEADRARFVDFLVPANQAWAAHAPVLIAVISKKTFSHNGSPNPTYHFDAGTSWGFLALAAAQQGLITHGMAGFDGDKARETLEVPENYDILAMVALGKHGDPTLLPEKLREREVPSNRRPQTGSIMEGKFTG